MAGLVEDTRWRTSARGRRYMMATLSDNSGQFVATAFEDEATAALEAAAKAGQCGLLTVELDRRAGDETPARHHQAHPASRRSRQANSPADDDPPLVAVTAEQIVRELADARGSNGLVRFVMPLATGGEAVVIAGRDFALDAELAARIERIGRRGHVSTCQPKNRPSSHSVG